MRFFHRSPTSRMHHRLLDRLRLAYLATEDLKEQRFLHDNQRLITQGSQSSHDDESLYANWTEQEMPLYLARAVTFEQTLWTKLYRAIEYLRTQGFYPEAYALQAEKLLPVCDALQDTLQLELRWLDHPPTKGEEARLNTHRVRVNEVRVE